MYMCIHNDSEVELAQAWGPYAPWKIVGPHKKTDFEVGSPVIGVLSYKNIDFFCAV